MSTCALKGWSPSTDSLSHIFSSSYSLPSFCFSKHSFLWPSQLVLPGNTWWTLPRSNPKKKIKGKKNPFVWQKCNGGKIGWGSVKYQAAFPDCETTSSCLSVQVPALLLLRLLKCCRLHRSNVTPDFFQINKAKGSFSNQEHTEEANRLWSSRCFSKPMWISQWKKEVRILYLFLIKLAPVSKVCTKHSQIPQNIPCFHGTGRKTVPVGRSWLLTAACAQSKCLSLQQ